MVARDKKSRRQQLRAASDRHHKKLREDGKVTATFWISPEVKAALEKLGQRYGSKTAAVERALIEAAKALDESPSQGVAEDSEPFDN